MQGLLTPPILVGQSGKLVFNGPTPLFVYDNLSIKKTLGNFVLILINLGFGTKPMLSLALLTTYSTMLHGSQKI